MMSLIGLITTIITLYIFVLFVHVILSWLTAFNVVNPRHQLVVAIGRITYQLCEPALAPIRRLLQRFLPPMSIDLSPIVLILLLYFVRNLVIEYGYQLVM
jgi:YggT family protein